MIKSDRSQKKNWQFCVKSLKGSDERLMLICPSQESDCSIVCCILRWLTRWADPPSLPLCYSSPTRLTPNKANRGQNVPACGVHPDRPDCVHGYRRGMFLLYWNEGMVVRSVFKAPWVFSNEIVQNDSYWPIDEKNCETFSSQLAHS